MHGNAGNGTQIRLECSIRWFLVFYSHRGKRIFFFTIASFRQAATQPQQLIRKTNFFSNKFSSGLFPTQDKNQPKAGFCPSGFIIFCLPKNLHSYHITQGVVNFPKICTKSSSLQPNFFCPIYSLLLMSNNNLSFLPFKHPIRGGQLPKNVWKILQSLAELFLAASRTFFVRSILFF